MALDNYVTIRKKTSGAKAIGIKVTPRTETDLQKNVTINSFGNKVGSHTTNIGDGGGQHTLIARVPGKDIKMVESILNYDGFIELTSQSQSSVSGTYRVMSAKITQIKGLKQSRQNKNHLGQSINVDKFEVQMVLQKHITPSVSSRVFNNWNANAKTTTGSNVKSSSSSSKANAKAKSRKLSDCSLSQVSYGKTNECIRLYQLLLREKKYYIQDQGVKLKVDGYFGYYTKRATSKYQKNNGLKVTGTFNTQTKKHILR